MKMHSAAKVVFFVAVLFALQLGFASTLFAQVESGTINGVVLDNSGAVISGARVTITHTATSQVRTTVTNASGEYSVPFLAPGTYDVEASKDGFATVVQRGVTLQVNQTLGISLSLKPGSLQQKIEVAAELPPLQTETATLGNVVNSQQVQTLPLNGRNFMDLASLTAGTTPAEPGSRNQAEGGFSSNGNRSYDNNIMLDGVDNNSLSPDLRNGTDFMVSPPPDAIEEFNVETNGYGPEFGRGGGAAVNIAIKSGSNAFHGNVWEYLRNEKLDARNFFDTTDTKTPPYKQNQFGFTFGGPIIKNRTFFFGDYQGTRIRNTETFRSVVPTLAERTGDFSDGLLGPPGGPIDPATGKPITPSDPNIDPLALQLAQLYPLPNSPDVFNFVFNPVQAINTDQFDVRVDHSFGQSMPTFVRVSHTRNHLNNPGELPGLALGAQGTLEGNTMQNNSTGVAIGITRVFSPTIVNDLRVGYARLEITQLPFFGNDNVNAQYGIPGIPFVPGFTGGLPVLSFSDVQQLGAEGCVPTVEITNVFTYRDVLSLTRGKHKMSMGFEGRPSEFTIFQPCDGRGHWNYGGGFTGSGFGDFLLQLPDDADLATLHNIDYKRSNYGLFFGDNWHLTTRLNLNLGLRWEYHSPVWERKNQQAALGFDGNYYVSGPAANVPAGFIFPVKESPWGKYLNAPHRKDFAPRLGLAYQVNAATIVRASYGIFWQAEEIGTYSNPSPGFNPPYYIRADFPAQAGPTVNATVNKLSNGFPANAITSGFDSSSVGYTRLQPDFADGYVQEWNLTVQRQLDASSSIEVAYMGSKGTHLINGATGNQATPSPDVNADFQPRRPIPSLFSETFDILSNAYSNYNGLGITFRRNFAHGFSANVAYTWSHALDIASSSNLGSGNNGYYRSEANQNWEYGNADIDQRHRLTAYYTWQLPFGHGQKFAGNASGVLDRIIGGWSHLGIWSWHTGNYFTAVIDNDYSNSGAPQARPDLTCNPNHNAPHTTTDWFNTSCFALPARGTYGNAGRNIILGPGYFNTNLSLMKDFHFTEARYLQFRVEFFNAFNHPNFVGISALTAFTPPEAPITQPQTGTLDTGQMGAILNAFAPRQVQLALKFYF
jgi:Carboxypeptidase regulatory-like domain/TonB dependent receptor